MSFVGQNQLIIKKKIIIANKKLIRNRKIICTNNLHQTRTPKVRALGLTRPYIMQTVILFGDFINKELSWGRNLASNSLLQLEEMYQDRKFMTKPHAQLNLVKVKRPTMLKYLYYFQGKMPHVTQVHKKIECLLHVLTLNASGSDKNFF